MKLKNMKKEELEVLSYTDLTEMVLKENKKTMNTASIFKTICELLELSEEDYSNSIGDFYTSLTTDKRFILLDNAEWDLRDKHKVDFVLDEEDDEEEYSEDYEESEDEEESEKNEEENEEDSLDITDDEVDLDDDDDMDSLTIVTDEELDENE